MSNQPISAQLSHAHLHLRPRKQRIFAGKPVLKIILHWKGLTQGYSTDGGSG